MVQHYFEFLYHEKYLLMTNLIVANHSVPYKIIHSVFIFLLISISCSKKKEAEITPIQLNPTPKVNFTAVDATEAMNAFNTNFYSTADKLYYNSTLKNKLAAIWVQAIYWDMIMNTYKRTKDPVYLQKIEDLYQGGYNKYDKYNWENKVEWFIYDDMMWWIISLARAYVINGQQKNLFSSKAGFARVWRDSYDVVNGGMYWDFARTGKMACINFPTVIGATTLYNITKDVSYLNKAKEIYAWTNNTLFDKTNGMVADHKVGNNPTYWKVHTYNQATCIGAGVMLYKVTNEKKYLNDAVLAADYTQNSMSSSTGILSFETGIEQGIYNAILAQYIIRLIEDGNQPKYESWIRHNINVAWGNRDKTRGITYKEHNVPCPTGTVESYDASGIPAFMQIIAPIN
jgi:predicted alpha-1,6-mannanase (GH76 family)